MNQDQFEGQWKQARGQAREWWGKLTDDDLDRVAGKYTNFTGVLQAKLGYAREHAEKEFHRRLKKHQTPHQKSVAPPL